MKVLSLVRSWRLQFAVALIAVFAFEVRGIGRPSFWADEVATISASHRSVPHILSLLQVIDAVHGTYYLFMHFWAGLFGFGQFALRLPSAIAVTVAVGFTYLIARKLFDARVAWISLVVAAVIPRLTWAATEARSYAIDAALAAAVLYLLLQAIESTGRSAKWWWIAYTFTLTLAIHFFIYTALYAGATGLWILWQRREVFRRWLLAMGVATAVAMYLIVWSIIEKGQVGWLPPINGFTVPEIFVGQAFWGSVNLALLANGLLIALFAGARHASRPTAVSERGPISLLFIAIALPPAIIIGYSIFGKSIYDSRYFSYAAPLVALAIGLALERLFSKRTMPLALVALLILAIPAYLSFRTVDAKGTHWQAVAKVIQKVSKPGDGILYTDFERRSPSQSRLKIAYPAEMAKVTDLTATQSYLYATGLFPHRNDPAVAASGFNTHPRILVLAEATEKPQFAKLQALLSAKGFEPAGRVLAAHSWLYIYNRK